MRPREQKYGLICGSLCIVHDSNLQTVHFCCCDQTFFELHLLLRTSKDVREIVSVAD